MKKTLFVVAMILGFVCCTAFSAEKINVQIVYDCSGSMGAKIEGHLSKTAIKSEVAKDAFRKIVVLMNNFEKLSPDSEINVGIVSFKGGKNGVILPLQKFSGKLVTDAIGRLPMTGGNTPLGDALKTAYDGLPKEGRSHIFILSDGEENGDLKMTDVIKTRKDAASLYFVAFDVKAETFNGVKNLGAMVVQADNAEELNTSVQTIFTQNILLEKED